MTWWCVKRSEQPTDPLCGGAVSPEVLLSLPAPFWLPASWPRGSCPGLVPARSQTGLGSLWALLYLGKTQLLALALPLPCLQLCHIGLSPQSGDTETHSHINLL